MTVLRCCQALTLLTALLVPCAAAQSISELDIGRAVEVALSKHAALQAAEERVRGSAGIEQQAGLRPNPEFSFQTENWRAWGTPSFSPASDLDVFAFVSQPLEARGKRSRRIELAAQDRKLMELESRALRWKIRQDVRQAFLRALAAQKEVELLQENGRYLDQVVEYHRIRVEEGAMAEADLIRVRLERERMKVLEDSAAAAAEGARAGLIKAMGITGADVSFRLLDESVTNPSGPPLNMQQLLERARNSRAETMLADAAIERAKAQADLERAQARPDLAIVAGYKRTADFNTILAGVTIPLPLLNRNQGNIVQSEVEIDRARSLRQAVLASIEGDIRTALSSVRRRLAMLQSMQKGVLERAEESWRISNAAYQEGGADLLRLLDAQRVRNEIRLLFVRTQMEYRLNLTELESAVGEENLVLSEEILRVAP